jgi:predicted N-acetyltransferase YhbS
MVDLPDKVNQELRPGTSVRCARESDFQAVLDLLDQMHPDARSQGDAREAADVDHLRQTFAGILSNSARTILVVETGGTVVGTVELFVMDNLTRGGRPWAGVENFVVDCGSRGSGIGLGLMLVVTSIARRCGCYKIQLVSHSDRDAAHTVYRRAGFDAPVQGYRVYLD